MSSNGVSCTIMTMLVVDPRNIFSKKIMALEPLYILGFLICDDIELSQILPKPFLFRKWRAILVLSL